MSNLKYTITKCENETGDTAKKLRFGKFDLYVTDAVDESGMKKISGVSTSINEISNGTSVVPSEDLGKWMDACKEYISKYNKELENATVRFELIDELDNSYFEFDKYVNDKLVLHDTGGYFKLKTKTDREAWKAAVEEYNAKNGIEYPIDKMRGKIKKVKDAIAGQDKEFPDEMSLTPPMLETVIAEFASGLGDPCAFLEKLAQAIAIAIPKSNPGLIKETLNYEIKALKHNAKVKVQKMANASSNMLAAVANPVLDEIDHSLEGYAETTIAMKEAEKRWADAIAAQEIYLGTIYEDYTDEYLDSITRPAIEIADNSDVFAIKKPDDHTMTQPYEFYEQLLKDNNITKCLRSPAEKVTKPNDPISSHYGMRVFNGKEQFHYGVDLRCAIGTKLYAIAKGTVVQAVKVEDGDGGGCRVIIKHGPTLYTMCCHMSEVAVNKYDEVEVGQYIGLSGNTGPYSTGPHLHYAVGYKRGPNWEINSEEFLFTLARL